MIRDALISKCGRYRWWLSREDLSEHGRGSVTFFMLNPSTADHNTDDPTIRRCIGFAKDWGYKDVYVMNLYSLISTDPKGLLVSDDPVGELTDSLLKEGIEKSDLCVCAWGSNAKNERVKEFFKIANETGKDLWCLGKTNGGYPRHPLYVKKEKLLEIYTQE